MHRLSAKGDINLDNIFQASRQSCGNSQACELDNKGIMKVYTNYDKPISCLSGDESPNDRPETTSTVVHAKTCYHGDNLLQDNMFMK